MLVTFKSKAAGDVMMFGDVAEQLLAIVGKPLGKQGILTPEQLPDAIARLKHAAGDSKAQRQKNTEEGEDTRKDERPFVSMAQRAVPLLELFERSLKAKAPVTWGV